MSQHAAKKLPYLLRYVSHQYKSQQACHQAILVNNLLIANHTFFTFITFGKIISFAYVDPLVMQYL